MARHVVYQWSPTPSVKPTTTPLQVQCALAPSVAHGLAFFLSKLKTKSNRSEFARNFVVVSVLEAVLNDKYQSGSSSAVVCRPPLRCCFFFLPTGPIPTQAYYSWRR